MKVIKLVGSDQGTAAALLIVSDQDNMKLSQTNWLELEHFYAGKSLEMQRK